MKNKIFAISALLMAVVASFTSCNKVIPSITFQSSPYVIDIDVAKSQQTGYIVLATKVVDSQLKADLNKQGVDLDKIESITLTKAKLEIVSGASNFDALSSVDLLVSSPSISTVSIATQEIPKSVSTIDVNLVEANKNITNLLKGDNFTVTVKGNVTQPVTVDTKLKLTLQADIKTK
jgi:hypothetical protein